VPEEAASNVRIGALTLSISTFICFSHNGSFPLGSPFPSTNAFCPHLLGLPSFLMLSAGINVPSAIFDAMEGTTITSSEVINELAFLSFDKS